MRSKAEIREYQRQYYLLCIQVDQQGMRQQWRESKQRKKLKLKSIGAERSSISPQNPMRLEQAST